MCEKQKAKSKGKGNNFTTEDIINVPVITSHPFRYPIGLEGPAVRRTQLAAGLAFCVTVDRAMSKPANYVAYDARHELPSPGHTYTGITRSRF